MKTKIIKVTLNMDKPHKWKGDKPFDYLFSLYDGVITEGNFNQIKQPFNNE
jgi:hypothetical protein